MFSKLSWWSPNADDGNSPNDQKCLGKIRVDNESVFTINGKPYKVVGEHPLNMSLNTFIRDVADHKGTKFMCEEGGCGCCVVTVSAKNPVSGEDKIFAVNSCLVFVLSCHGWSITTVEGIGSKEQGYHPIQATLAKFNGTQCGYCSPGMVMNMYSLLAANKDLTMQEVENSFAGNICRCTGYRPILDAFKSFCVDAPPSLRDRCMDIEDIGKYRCPYQQSATQEAHSMDEKVQCALSEVGIPVHIVGTNGDWYRVQSVDEVFEIFNIIGDKTYQLVAGNTGRGAYHVKEEPQVYIDIRAVPELQAVVTNTAAFTVGANITLADFINFLRTNSTTAGYAYFSQMVAHIELVANVPVRNVGTVAGNLSLKYQHNDFSSDIFLLLELVRATLNIRNDNGNVSQISPQDFLKTDMKKKLITQFILYPLENYTIKTYKIMPRAQNVHAVVNAGFLFKMTTDNTYKVLEKPRIIYGGISPKFVHATSTEDFLSGKQLNQQLTLTGALQLLDVELQPEDNPPEMSPAYRKGLAKSLFYKCVLNIVSKEVKKEYVSGGNLLSRPISTGKQTFQTNPSDYPAGQPVTKLEALPQCSGEAEYVNDRPLVPDELHAAFVLTTVPNGIILQIDATEALKVPGVIAFYKAQDIPGINNATPIPTLLTQQIEELFCSGAVLYNGQPLGVIVAETRQIANKAKLLVKVQYSGSIKPIIHIPDVIISELEQENNHRLPGSPSPHTGNNESELVTNVIEGKLYTGFQYHYHMEVQTCSVVPTEDGYEVYTSSQWMDICQLAVAQTLGTPAHRISVYVRRMGGGFGAKLTRANYVACACAVAAYHLRQPVRMVMTMEDNMRALGKRTETLTSYRVGFDGNGKIQFLTAVLYENAGSALNDSSIILALRSFGSCYVHDTWSLIFQNVLTNVPSNTFMRAPGSVEVVAGAECVMEHIAKSINKDPVEVRLNNIKSDHPIVKFIDNIRTSSNYTNRKQQIAVFNKENRWMKKGIALVPMRYDILFFGNQHCIVSIYAGDGSVVVSHGGTECGQGINTKVAQVVSYTLGIPMELVKITTSNTLVSANDMCTGGSITSDKACFAAIQCCKELLARLEDTAKSFDNPSWQDLVSTASNNGVDLVASSMLSSDFETHNYDVYGACVLEVMVDILTGMCQIVRADILEDVGKSLSPNIDMGQIEGGFVMGLGLWTSEDIVIDANSGELLTNRSWNYWPPGAKDIPVDFRVEMQKNMPNPVGVLRSKTTGEPAVCLAFALPLAIRNALESARKDAGNNGAWFNFKPPLTLEKIWQYSLTSSNQFTIK